MLVTGINSYVSGISQLFMRAGYFLVQQEIRFARTACGRLVADGTRRVVENPAIKSLMTRIAALALIMGQMGQVDYKRPADLPITKIARMTAPVDIAIKSLAIGALIYQVVGIAAPLLGVSATVATALYLAGKRNSPSNAASLARHGGNSVVAKTEALMQNIKKAFRIDRSAIYEDIRSQAFTYSVLNNTQIAWNGVVSDEGARPYDECSNEVKQLVKAAYVALVVAHVVGVAQIFFLGVNIPIMLTLSAASYAYTIYGRHQDDGLASFQISEAILINDQCSRMKRYEKGGKQD